VESNARLPRALTFDSEYWLCRCEGFCVDSAAGRVGVVEGLRFRSRLERPDALAVRVGLLHRRHLLVPVSQIAEIAPSKGLIVLRTAPDAARGGLVQRLRGWSRPPNLPRVTPGSRDERAG
jgi:hypothetical protein